MSWKALLALILLLLSGCMAPTNSSTADAVPPEGGGPYHQPTLWVEDGCCSTLFSNPETGSETREDAGRALEEAVIWQDEGNLLIELTAHAEVPSRMQFGVEYAGPSSGPLMSKSGLYGSIGDDEGRHSGGATFQLEPIDDGLRFTVPLSLLDESASPGALTQCTVFLRGNTDRGAYFDAVDAPDYKFQ